MEIFPGPQCANMQTGFLFTSSFLRTVDNGYISSSWSISHADKCRSGRWGGNDEICVMSCRDESFDGKERVLFRDSIQ